jgi:hypothetical protein
VWKTICCACGYVYGQRTRPLTTCGRRDATGHGARADEQPQPACTPMTSVPAPTRTLQAKAYWAAAARWIGWIAQRILWFICASLLDYGLDRKSWSASFLVASDAAGGVRSDRCRVYLPVFFFCGTVFACVDDQRTFIST